MAAPDKLKTQLRNEHERVTQLQDSNRRLREQIARDSGKQPTAAARGAAGEAAGEAAWGEAASQTGDSPLRMQLASRHFS
jgi:hypothetical protein